MWGDSMPKQSNNTQGWDFPGGPVVKTSPSNAGGEGSIPGQRAKILYTSRPKHKQYCNKFNEDFKNGPHKKKNLKKRTLRVNF